MDFSRYIEYIKNTGESLKVAWFDDDWEPIGPMVRAGMEKAGLIKISDNQKIHLTEKRK